MIAALLLVAVFLIWYEKDLMVRRTREHKARAVDIATSHGERVSLAAIDGTKYKYCRNKSGYRRRFFGFGIGGFFQGATGFGIGEMGIVSMILSRVPVRVSIGTSHLIVAVTAISASLIHFLLADSGSGSQTFPWNIPVMTVPAVVIAGQIAPHIAAKLPTKYLERAISALFITIAAALILLAVKQ